MRLLLICRSLIFRVGVGEAEEIVLVHVHDDELVSRRQVHGHFGELLVKVAGVPAVLLQVESRCYEGEGVQWQGELLWRGG